MSLVDPCSPVSNTIIFYIIIIITIFILKPEIMYSKKNNKFKSFGFGKDETLFSLSSVGIFSSIILYMFFSTIDSLCSKLNKD